MKINLYSDSTNSTQYSETLKAILHSFCIAYGIPRNKEFNILTSNEGKELLCNWLNENNISAKCWNIPEIGGGFDINDGPELTALLLKS